MSYITVHSTATSKFDTFYDGNEAIGVEEELIHAKHHENGVVHELLYFNGSHVVNGNGELLFRDPYTFKRRYEVKPRAEQEQFVEDFHTSTMRIISERAAFVKEMVSAL